MHHRASGKGGGQNSGAALAENARPLIGCRSVGGPKAFGFMAGGIGKGFAHACPPPRPAISWSTGSASGVYAPDAPLAPLRTIDRILDAASGMFVPGPKIAATPASFSMAWS